MQNFDTRGSLNLARGRLPLETLMERNGYAPKSGRWKNFRCPFCSGRDASAGVVEHGGFKFFK